MSAPREILLAHRQERDELLQKSYIPREGLKNARDGLKHNLVQVVTGPRRSGKSVFCLELLGDTPFAYVNFDDERIVQLTDYDDLIAAIREVYGPNQIFLFDEIQNLARWELFVNRLQRKGIKLILTGSNSRLLSRELATHLTGRHLAHRILPFSFREYLQANNVAFTTTPQLKEHQGDLRHHLEKYQQCGGYPEIVVRGIEPKSYLKTLFESILFTDIVKRYNVRYPQKLYDLATYLFTHHASEFSYTALRKFLAFRSVHTVEKYVGFLEEAFLLLKVGRFSFAPKERVKSPKKGYGIDTGMIEAVKFKTSPDSGRLMENTVALELYRKEVDFYSYKTRTGKEVDFVIKEGPRVTGLIQVCYDLSVTKTRDREVKALVEGMEELQGRHGVVLTWDEEGEQNVSGKHLSFIPLWKWLLGKSAP
ncbi:MAG: ATP-binding protein [Deltaproteobacteria bacterium]|nr:ATP-binding protein [Deltaproteobacteria bacterium]